MPRDSRCPSINEVELLSPTFVATIHPAATQYSSIRSSIFTVSAPISLHLLVKVATVPSQPHITTTTCHPAMATTTAPPYNYSRGAASATRALLDSSNVSPETASGTDTPSNPMSPHATLHRRKTNHYESALVERLNVSLAETHSSPLSKDATTLAPSNETGPTISSGLAYRGDEAAAKSTPHSQQAYASADRSEGISRPGLSGSGMLGRQQSWKQADQKRAVMERMLSSAAAGDGHKAGGYSSSVSGSPA